MDEVKTVEKVGHHVKNLAKNMPLRVVIRGFDIKAVSADKAKTALECRGFPVVEAQ